MQVKEAFQILDSYAIKRAFDLFSMTFFTLLYFSVI